jgi:3-deoxy-D-manno-oct-2-ulosonic acid (Kdo) hydroxylase
VNERETNSAPDVSADELERSDLVVFPDCPFQLPPIGQLEFLRRQPTAGFGHKDVSFDPVAGKLGWQRGMHPSEARRLADVLGDFSAAATDWLKANYPGYAAGLLPDRATLRTEEEATRPLRLTARNDLLHIDNFPTRPTGGRRVLRLYVNINATDAHVWATSDRFLQMLARYAARHRVPVRTRAEWMAPAQSLVRLFTGRGPARSAYDAWMLRLHHFLKEDEAFQAQPARKMWTFPPRSMWLLFSDSVAHGLLRGRFALDHSFFVDQDCLSRPADSPLAELERYGRTIASRRAS